MKEKLLNIKKRISYRFNLLSVLEFLLLMSIWPMMMYADSLWFKEDGVVENIQLLICFVSLFLCIRARNNKSIFYFLAFLLFLIICREVNTGRHWLCSYYNIPHDSRWEDVPYGLIIKWVRNGIAILAFVYFLAYKVWQPLGQCIKKAPIYVWDFLFLLIAAILSQVAEKPFDNEIMEEMSELLMYLALLNCIWHYGYGKNEH